ncbi:MAG: HlyD family efflux transporter periplasmic adaptor subunit [Gemmataceae bacterium]
MSESRRTHRWPWLLGILVLAVSAIGARWALQGSEADHAKDPKETAPPGMIAIGYVDVEAGVAHLHPAQQGIILSVAEEGKDVAKGAVILQLDPTLAQGKLAEAQAALDEAKQKLAQAEKLPEQNELKKKQQETAIEEATVARDKAQAAWQFAKEVQMAGKATLDLLQQDVEKAKVAIKREQYKLDELKLYEPAQDLARAKADVDAKKAQRDQAKWALDQCSLKAPADGTVLRVNVQKGEVLGANPPLPAVEFVPKGPRIVRAEVLQEWASKVRIGQKAIVQDDTFNGEKYEGEVIRLSPWFSRKRHPVIEPFMMNDVRTMEALVKLPENQDLRIGQRVRVRIVLDEIGKK